MFNKSITLELNALSSNEPEYTPMGNETVAGPTDEEEGEETNVDDGVKYEEIKEKSQELEEKVIEKPLYINLSKYNHVTYSFDFI